MVYSTKLQELNFRIRSMQQSCRAVMWIQMCALLTEMDSTMIEIPRARGVLQ